MLKAGLVGLAGLATAMPMYYPRCRQRHQPEQQRHRQRRLLAAQRSRREPDPLSRRPRQARCAGNSVVSPAARLHPVVRRSRGRQHDASAIHPSVSSRSRGGRRWICGASQQRVGDHRKGAGDTLALANLIAFDRGAAEASRCLVYRRRRHVLVDSLSNPEIVDHQPLGQGVDRIHPVDPRRRRRRWALRRQRLYFKDKGAVQFNRRKRRPKNSSRCPAMSMWR